MDTPSKTDLLILGKDCPGIAPKGICYFDEFVKWI